MLTILSWLMVIVFMILILKKVMHPFTAIVLVPVGFSLLGGFLGLYQERAAATLEMAVADVGIWDQVRVLGNWVKAGITKTSGTAFLLFFAILFFSIMLDAGLFDPLTKCIIRLAKGDPVRVLVGTSILATIVSLSGDGTTTTLICCTAFIPIYKKLDLKMMNLAVIVILQNTILNLLPWSGPTARVIAVVEGIDVQELMRALLPGMILAILFVIGVSYYLGLKERQRLGIKNISEAEMQAIFDKIAAEGTEFKRPKLAFVNMILTILSLFFLISGIFEAVFVFIIASCLALLINYPKISDQKKRLYDNAGEILTTVIMIIGAGVFMGLFSSTGMSDALATSLINIIPQSWGRYWGLIVTFISAPGGFFLSNDAFFYSVLPVLSQAGLQYGFSGFEMGFASLLGQAFHMLSPLTAFIYLLLSLTEQDMGEWQKACFKWTVGIFVIFVGTALVLQIVPLYV